MPTVGITSPADIEAIKARAAAARARLGSDGRVDIGLVASLLDDLDAVLAESDRLADVATDLLEALLEEIDLDHDDDTEEG